MKLRFSPTWVAPVTAAVLVLGGGSLVALEKTSNSATPPNTAAPADVADAAPAVPAPTPEDADEKLGKRDTAMAITAADTLPAPGSFDYMPDGSAVPGLPSEAPRRVRLAIALFRYEGAEGAGSSSRSRSQALELATKTLKENSDDFAAIVKAADPGSSEEMGWIGRGILELSVEYAVFSLEKGQTRAEPLDTPRGYWIVRRVK